MLVWRRRRKRFARRRRMRLRQRWGDLFGRGCTVATRCMVHRCDTEHSLHVQCSFNACLCHQLRSILRSLLDGASCDGKLLELVSGCNSFWTEHLKVDGSIASVVEFPQEIVESHLVLAGCFDSVVHRSIQCSQAKWRDKGGVAYRCNRGFGGQWWELMDINCLPVAFG